MLFVVAHKVLWFSVLTWFRNVIVCRYSKSLMVVCFDLILCCYCLMLLTKCDGLVFCPDFVMLLFVIDLKVLMLSDLTLFCDVIVCRCY